MPRLLPYEFMGVYKNRETNRSCLYQATIFWHLPTDQILRKQFLLWYNKNGLTG